MDSLFQAAPWPLARGAVMVADGDQAGGRVPGLHKATMAVLVEDGFTEAERVAGLDHFLAVNPIGVSSVGIATISISKWLLSVKSSQETLKLLAEGR